MKRIFVPPGKSFSSSSSNEFKEVDQLASDNPDEGTQDYKDRPALQCRHP